MAILNNSLHSNPALIIENPLPSIFSLFHLNSLSRALRKDPDLDLRRSKSLCNLSKLCHDIKDVDSEQNTMDGVDVHQSCPDLLEMQSLHDLHPKIHESFVFSQYYYSESSDDESDKSSDSSVDRVTLFLK